MDDLELHWQRQLFDHMVVHLHRMGGLTWVGDRGDSDFVVGFTCAEACNDVLDPPQLLPDLGFLVLRRKI